MKKINQRTVLILKQQLIRLVVLVFVSTSCFGQIYYYRGSDGSIMVSDHAISDPSYSLESKRDDLEDAGYILAKNRIPVGGRGKFQRHIKAASSRYGIDPMLVEAIIEVESGFNPRAVSKKGAGGLMQLMGSTAKRYDVKNRFDPEENIYAGVKHLKYLMGRFDDKLHLVLAAYNAGATTVERYGGIPPYPETRRYVAKVRSTHSKLRADRFSLLN